MIISKTAPVHKFENIKQESANTQLVCLSSVEYPIQWKHLLLWFKIVSKKISILLFDY